MRYYNEDMTLWYGTHDAPTPSERVEEGAEIEFTIAVKPIDASNRVQLLYRINKGPIEKPIAATFLRTDYAEKSQYFLARFSEVVRSRLRPGDLVEFSAICDCAGRKVPSAQDARRFNSSFRITGAEARSARNPEPRVTPVLPNPQPEFPYLQTRNLVMTGLGILQDLPPNTLQPPLADGIHLRWAYNGGFPWYGFYLYSRPHERGVPICLSSLIPRRGPGLMTETQLGTSYGTIISDVNLLLTDDFTPQGALEFDLSGRRNLRFSLRDNHAARRVEVKIGFRQAGQITVTAIAREPQVDQSTEQLRESAVDQSIVTGQAGDIISTELEFDAISDIDFSSGPACVVDICFVPVWQGSRFNWHSIIGFEYPMRLPLTQPEYPCTMGMDENLTLARTLARGRIRYGNPDQFTSEPTSLTTQGFISVNNGSMIVTGIGTNWNHSLVGKTLQVAGDVTAYAIIKVLRSNELILGRIYTGVSRSNIGYSINQDPFAQLHDYLVQLVKGGPSTVPIPYRYTPAPIYDTGRVEVRNGSMLVTGDGTNWNSDLNDLALWILEDSAGTVSVNKGDRIVTGDGTNWDNRLASMIIEINGDRRTYTIARVNSANELLLNEEYRGRDVARRRYTIRESREYQISNVNSPTSLTLNRDFAGISRQASRYNIVANITPDQTITLSPSMPRQYILDLILLGALHPAVAQMSGLYWVDNTTGVNAPFDYLIVANNSGPILTEREMLDRIGVHGFVGLDAYIVFNKKKTAAAPLVPPAQVISYVLPSTSLMMQNCSTQDRSDIVGLRWDIGKTSLGVLLPGKPIMYHLWRSDLGIQEPLIPPSDDRLIPITIKRPILVADTTLDPRNPPKRPRNWPDFALHTIDTRVQDGWYSYKVSGIDIFGRHSSTSAFAEWFQWGSPSSAPPEPLPYYYREPPEDRQIHPFAINLLDKEPPPPPAGVEAYALDPADPTVLKDLSYTTWQNSLISSDWYQALTAEQRSNLIGLRVSWKWRYNEMRQAPDTREFRIYYQPDQLNAKTTGRTITVSLISNNQAEVETDIFNSLPADAYKGCWLQIGTDKFLIIGNAAGSPLTLFIRLRDRIYEIGTIKVTNNLPYVTGNRTNWDDNVIGLTFNVQGENSRYLILEKHDVEFGEEGDDFTITLDRNYDGITDRRGKAYTISGRLPTPNKPCAIFVPSPPLSNAGSVYAMNGSPYLDGYGTNWDNSLVNCGLKIGREEATYMITGVDSLTRLILDRVYDGPTGQNKTYSINPLFIDYSSPTNWNERYHVVSYDEHFTQLVEAAYDITGKTLAGNQATIVTGTPTTILLDGNPDLSHVKANYDQLFLENDTNQPNNKLYCIAAVDNVAKTVTLYEAPSLVSNTSSWVIGWPYRKYEIFLPDPASTYHSGIPLVTSLEQPIVYADIGISAADNKTYTSDDPKWDTGRWGNRYGNEGSVSAPATIFRVRRVRPEPPIPPPDSEKVYASPADYHGHSYYTYRWSTVSNLRTHIFRALDESLFNVDWSRRGTDRQNLNADELQFFPKREVDPRWTVEKRQQVADELNRLNNFDHNDPEEIDEAMTYYRRQLSNDSLRILAGLPGNERAFSQLTVQPLDPNDAANDNRRGPDNPLDFPVDQNLKAYIDTLDGRSPSNCYFYRSAYVDLANNMSPLSISSPPICLHDVIPPRAPVITKVVGGDKQITLNWAPNREPDLAEYRIYRTDNEKSTRDLQLMEIVNIHEVTDGDPSMRPAEMTWTHSPMPPLKTFYYIIVAVDRSQNVSVPSSPVAAQAYNYSPPIEPNWERSEWVKLDADGNEHPWSDTMVGLVEAVVLIFTTNEDNVSASIERKNLTWHIASPGVRKPTFDSASKVWRFTFYDRNANPSESQRYRAYLISSAGVILHSAAERLVEPPTL